eukprot:CAMPEP_0195305350 /NCGR_PEP_ID=MMETSP0707-20130614/36137_1 /TAXON_ID=33640 /ORGANISM="Asterionellopsis glacialis, Strain CCMP134" /LENGTH=355 /DNA_ID=CAMNT_0040369443 /DNA_START=128 /DNA_END=1195 /DNA_ORIENTATION=+
MGLFGRSNSSGLPLAGTTSSRYNGPDGSGKAIHMDAPIVRNWKNSSKYTKGTYYFLVFSIFITFWGIRSIRYNHGSVWLTCTALECTLEINPPYGKNKAKLQFARKHLVASYPVKVDKDGTFQEVDKTGGMGSYQGGRGRSNKKANKYRKGPDVHGWFDSYSIHLKSQITAVTNEDGGDDDDATYPNPHIQQPGRTDTPKISDITSQLQTVSPEYYDRGTQEDKDKDNYIFYMRQFNLGKSRRRTRTQTTKVESYIAGRRHRLNLKENSGLAWQGVLAIVVGIFTFILTILLGQFADEPKGFHAAKSKREEQLLRERRRRQQHQQTRYGGGSSGVRRSNPSINKRSNVGTQRRGY